MKSVLSSYYIPFNECRTIKIVLINLFTITREKTIYYFMMFIMLDITSCMAESINRRLAPTFMHNKNNIIHSTILIHFYIPFASAPFYSTGYEPRFAHSFSNTFFCNGNRILKDFHDFWDCHLLREFYSQYSHSKEGYLTSIVKHSLSIITVDKSCRHRMHFHSKIPRFQVHSFIPSFSLSNFRRLPCFLASLPQREKVICTHKKLLPYLAFKSLYNSGAEWELITPTKHHLSDVSERIFPLWKAWCHAKWHWLENLRIHLPLPRQPYVAWFWMAMSN